MKGFTKAIKRTPHAFTTKVGMSKKSTDPEFDDYQRHFGVMETSTEKLIKETKVFTEGVINLFTAGAGFATHFSVLFHPIAGEYDLIGKNPEAGHTIRSIGNYEATMEELRASIAPELELIESRIAAPLKDFQGVLKTIRKTITKREHKLTDYDRFNNSLTKLRDKKEKSLSDEKNLFKLEQDFELATNEYDFINNALKTDLPRFMMLSTQFIDPLFHSFFYMQLNIFYLMLEKMNAFAEESKFDIANVPGAQIAEDYENKRTDAWSRIEELGIIKRIISVSRLVQANRAQNGGAPATVGRAPSTASSASSSRLPPPARGSPSAFVKKAPPPPPGNAPAPPPPYSSGGGLSSSNSTSGASAFGAAAAAKRAPPPPPPLKPKPKPAPQVQYVVALYDFVAQAEGDLSFSTGDHIEIVERTSSAEDWWTGKVHGQQGVFPGNYVQDT